MKDFSSDDMLARYRRTLSEKPDLARNPPGAAIELLTGDHDIALVQEEVRRTRGGRGLDTTDLRVGTLAADPYLVLLRDAVRFADGSYGLYNRIVEAPTVAVLPVCDGKPVLIRIFRHAVRAWSIEFPRGSVDAGESVDTTLRREIREEIGAKVMNWQHLGDFSPGGSTIAAISHLCFATVDAIGSVDAAEGIAEAFAVTIDQLEMMIRTAQIIDGFSISLFARARLSRLI